MKMDRGTKNAAYTQLQAKSILYSAESIYGQNENYCNKLIFFFSRQFFIAIGMWC
jgi:hypothetical protein